LNIFLNVKIFLHNEFGKRRKIEKIKVEKEKSFEFKA
jgi:hypothetical protein